MIQIHDGRDPRRGYRVSGYLAVAILVEEGVWGIYKDTDQKKKGGKVVEFTFQEVDDAFRFAEFLERHYNADQPLMYIWSDERYKELEFFCLMQYTVPNGEFLWELIDALNQHNKPLTHQQTNEIMGLINERFRSCS